MSQNADDGIGRNLTVLATVALAPLCQPPPRQQAAYMINRPPPPPKEAPPPLPEEPEDEQRSRQEKRKKVDLFESLPDDILLEILKRLPDPFLDYRAKYVCRRWMNLIIMNRILPDRASFILLGKGIFTACHVGIREEEGKGLQVKVKEYLDIPRIGMIRSWVNEFLLISDYKRKKGSLYVYNLITKEGSYLPKCSASCGGNCTDKCGVALSFDGIKGIYKVVHLFSGQQIKCHILILRRDILSSKWKKIQVPCMNGGWSFSDKPVYVQGRFIHWCVYDNMRLFSMDVVKEKIVDMLLPVLVHGHHMNYTIFEMGGSLALFAGVSEHEAEIWILKDFQMKTWQKLQSVTFEKWYHRRFPLCGVISSNKYIILESQFYDKGMWYYDLKNGAGKKLDIHIGFGDLCFVHSPQPTF